MRKRITNFLSNPERELDIYDLLTLFGFTLALFTGALILFAFNNFINLI